jgi:hypothetical protein
VLLIRGMRVNSTIPTTTLYVYLPPVVVRLGARFTIAVALLGFRRSTADKAPQRSAFRPADVLEWPQRFADLGT